jgi:nucleoid-associated protein EbfC
MMKNGQGGGMMKQVMQMQKQLKQAQKDLERETVIGSAGDGAVLVKMSGSQKCLGVKLDKDKISDVPVEKLEKYFEESIKDALEKSRKVMAEKIGPLSGGLGGLKF